MVTDLFERDSAGSDDPLLARLREVTVGQYEVAEELGRGGMAVVFLGKDLRLQRTVAIKVMDPRLSLIPGMAERFLQEARIAARLQHPNVIVVHDVQQMGDLIFFVMSLIEGGAIDEIVRHASPLPIEEARWILLEASRALAYAHSEGIVHRDMKPANILVNLKGEIILTDFGIAKAVDSSGLTKSGTQIGTPMYMSPEQFADRPVGPWSDQYALGITAYELIAGRPPFTGELYHLITAHLTKAPEPLRELRPECPPYLADAVMRMLEKSASDRWGSLDELEEVFGAGLARDAGGPRRQLAQRAQELHRRRAETVRALARRSGEGAIGAARTPPAAKSPISQVVVGTPRLTIRVGDTVRPSVQVLDEGGRERGDVALRWTSRTPAVALVEGEGTLRGVSTGETAVEVAAGSISQELVVTVVPRPATTLHVQSPSSTIENGRAISLVAIALDDRGSRVETPVQWSSSAPDIVHVDSAGTAVALGVGRVQVTATSGELREMVTLEGVPSQTAMLVLPEPSAPNEPPSRAATQLRDASHAPARPSVVRPGIKKLIIGTGVVVALAVLWEFLPHGDTFLSIRPNRPATALPAPNAGPPQLPSSATVPAVAGAAEPAPNERQAPRNKTNDAPVVNGSASRAVASSSTARLTTQSPPTGARPDPQLTSKSSVQPPATNGTSARVATDSAPGVRATAAPAPAAPPPEPRTTAKTSAVPSAKPPELPSADEVRLAADHIVDGVRSGTERNSELATFLSDGASPKVARAGDVTISGDDHGVVHAQFDLRLSKFDAGGRPVTRMSHVTIEVLKHDGVSTGHVVSFGTLTKSK